MRLQVKGPHGTQEAYFYSGGKTFDANLPAVVFVHGAMHDHTVWTLLARWFAHHGHAVVAPDLPGHSRSAGEPLQSIETLADWLLALLDAAGVDEAALVGHSMGSLTALEAAARAPTRIRRLALIGTAYPMAVSTALLEAGAKQPLAAIDNVNVFSHSTLAAKPSYPSPGMWLHGANRALMRRVQANRPRGNVFLDDFRVCDQYRAGLEAAARVTCPTTFILGNRDQMTSPKQTVEFARALRAEVVRLDAGHALMTEAPEGVLAALREALIPPATATTAGALATSPTR